MVKSDNANEPTTVAAYTEAIVRALDSYGVDPLKVLRQADVDRMRSNDPLERITDSEINALFARAVEATGDSSFGLRVADCIVPGTLHALGFALLASETLLDFCQRLVRYYGIVSQSAEFNLAVNETELRLSGIPRNRDLCFETQDVWVGLVIRLMRAVCQEDLRPLHLELLRPVPECGADPFIDYFGCPVSFSCEHGCFYFDRSIVEEPLPGASREMAQHNDQVAMAYLERLDRDDIVNRVRTHVLNGLATGDVGRDEIAARMNMSGSALRAKLARRGLSFQQLLDDMRQKLALDYLEQSRLSITEIAFMLGFSDVSNFNRAFRRWTGRTPSSYREKD